MPAYERLMEKHSEIALMGSTVMMLNWDMETYMPPGAVSLRGDQMGLMRRITHRMLTGQELGALISQCESESGSYDEVQSRNLYLIKRDRDIATSVSEDLVAAYTKQTAVARDAWARARNAKDWRVFLPELEKMTELSVQFAEATMEAKGAKTVFDSMIDDCERGMPSEQVAELLTGLRTALVPLVDRFSEAFGGVDRSCLLRPVPMEAQRAVVKDVVNLVGYDTVSDKARGRFDETIHPFTSGYMDDVRIALRFGETDLFDTILGGMHEAGHALYEQNVNHDWMYQPIADGASMGVHESCSRFVENMIGTSRGFWSFYLPRFRELTGTAYSDLALDALMKALNKVQRSKIRTKSDEVTYCLHIAIRFEIEHALFSGKATVNELPQMWNDLYDRYMKVKIEDDVEGVMQDVHWSTGAFGYFQSYALGNVYDGMYVKKLEKDMPGWQQEVEAGRPQDVLGWLKDKVHRWGSLYDPGDLVERVVGEPLSYEPFIGYLERKYTKLSDQ